MNMKVVMECMYQSMQWRWLRLAPQCFAFTSIIMIFIIDATSIFMVAMIFITIGTISDTNLFVYTRSGLGTHGGLAQVYVPAIYQ